jgi:hypothetical protein
MKRIVSYLLVLPLLLHTAFGCALHQDHAGHREHSGHVGHGGHVGHSGHGGHTSLCAHAEPESSATRPESSATRVASHEFDSDKHNGIDRCTGHACEVQQAISLEQVHPGSKQPCNGLCTHCTFPPGLPRLVLRDSGSNGPLVGSLPKSLCVIKAATIDTVRMDCARNPFAEIAHARVHLLLAVFLI